MPLVGNRGATLPEEINYPVCQADRCSSNSLKTRKQRRVSEHMLSTPRNVNVSACLSAAPSAVFPSSKEARKSAGMWQGRWNLTLPHHLCVSDTWYYPDFLVSGVWIKMHIFWKQSKLYRESHQNKHLKHPENCTKNWIVWGLTRFHLKLSDTQINLWYPSQQQIGKQHIQPSSTSHGQVSSCNTSSK